MAKKLLSLQPVVRTRGYYTWVKLIKRQKSFQGLAKYGHEVLMSLQKKWPKKFVQLITSVGTPSRPKLRMIGELVAPHMGEVVDWRSFFRCFVGQAHSRPRMCLWGLIDTSHPVGSYSQKPLIFGTSMGIYSLNVYALISAQKKRIRTLDSPKCATRQDTQCAIRKRWIGSFQRSNLQKFVSKPNSNHNR